MQARNNLLALLATSAALAVACGDDDDDTVIVVDCAGAGAVDAAGSGGSAGSRGEGGAPAAGTGGVPSSGAGGEATAPATRTSLRIIIDNRPPDSEVSVTITGPGGFSEVTGTSATFHDLEPGDYSVLSRPA